MADSTQNQNQAGNGVTPPAASSPWDEPLPEEKPKAQAVGGFSGIEAPKNVSTQPFALPNNLNPVAAPASVTTPSQQVQTNSAVSPSQPAPVQTVSVPPAPPVSSTNIATPNQPIASQPKSLDAIVATPPTQSPAAPIISNPAPVPPVAPIPSSPVQNQVTNPVPTNTNNTDATQTVPAPVAKEKKGFWSRFRKNKKTDSVSPVGAPMPQPRKGKKILFWLIFALIAIFALLVFLTEFGLISIKLENFYGTIKLEKIWGGLSKDSESALVKSFSTMKDNQNFKLTGTMSVLIDKTMKNQVTTPIVGYVSSDDDTSTSTTYKTVSTTKTVNATVSGDFTKSGNSVSIKIEKPISTETIDLKNSSSNLWVKTSGNIKFSDTAVANKWSLYSLGILKSSSVSDKISSISADQGFSTEGARTGNEKVDDVRCYKYSLKNFQVGDSLSGLGVSSKSIQSVSGTAWIGVKDKLIHRLDLKITMAMSQPIMQMSVSFYLSDYGNAATFSAPASSEIAQ